MGNRPALRARWRPTTTCPLQRHSVYPARALSAHGNTAESSPIVRRSYGPKRTQRFVLPLPYAPIDEGPVQALALSELPYLQSPLELQLTASGAVHAPAAVSGALALELGLLPRTQIGVTAGDEGIEPEFAALLIARPHGLHLAASTGAQIVPRKRCCGLALGLMAAHPIGPLYLSAFGEAERERQERITPSAGLALIAPLADWVPFLEGRWEEAGLGGAFGLRWHPIDAIELGGAGHLQSTAAGSSVGASLVLTFEAEMLDDSAEP